MHIYIYIYVYIMYIHYIFIYVYISQWLARNIRHTHHTRKKGERPCRGHMLDEDDEGTTLWRPASQTNTKCNAIRKEGRRQKQGVMVLLILVFFCFFVLGGDSICLIRTNSNQFDQLLFNTSFRLRCEMYRERRSQIQGVHYFGSARALYKKLKV